MEKPKKVIVNDSDDLDWVQGSREGWNEAVEDFDNFLPNQDEFNKIIGQWYINSYITADEGKKLDTLDILSTKLYNRIRGN